MKDFKIKFKEIEKQFSILEVAQNQLNMNLRPVGNNEYRGVSIAFGEHTHDDGFSLNSNTNEWYDFTLNQGGGILKLVSIVKYGNDSSIFDAAKYLIGDSHNFDSTYWKKYTTIRDSFLKDIENWHNKLYMPEFTSVLEYLHKRKITSEIIEKFKIGMRYDKELQEWRLVIPYYTDSNFQNPVYYVTRELTQFRNEETKRTKYKKAYQDEFFDNTPFGLFSIPYKESECTTLIIGEGMFDMLSAYMAGYSILSGIGGDFGKDNEKEVIAIAQKFDKVIFTFDADGAGVNFTKKLGKKFFDAGINFFCVNRYQLDTEIISAGVTNGLIDKKDVKEDGNAVKDLSAFYILGGDIHAHFTTVKPGLSFLAETLKSEIPFKTLSANDRKKVRKEFQDLSDKARKLLNSGVLDDSDILAAKEILSDYLPKKILDDFCENENAKILTPAELERTLKELEISLRLNVISRKCVIDGLPENSPLIQESFRTGNDSKKKRDSVELLPVFLTAYLKLHNYKFSQDYLKDCLSVISNSNEFNPVMEIVKSAKWDGVNRIWDLQEILGIQNFYFERKMLTKWLVQAISIIQNDDGYSNNDFALVLQGKQGKGKTLFFRKLAIRPEFFVEGAVIDMRVKDTIIISTGAWITELGELDSTLKKEQSDLKSFITAAKDRYRKPYARDDQDYPRRTCFCATVNPEKFLRDETGSRRFVVFNADKLDLPRLKSLDENFYIQLWSQVYDLYLKGEIDYRLTPDEIIENEKRNISTTIDLRGEREILESLDWNSTAWKFQSATDINNLLNLKLDVRVIGKALAKIAENDSRIEVKRGKTSYIYFLPTTTINNTSLFH